jgi:hypothetical protein
MPEKDPVEYRQADEVERIARDLIYDFHTHLATARIKYVFRSQSAESRGKEVWGRARKVTGLNAWLAGKEKPGVKCEPLPFFVIEISEPVWKILDENQKQALVDHELITN